MRYQESINKVHFKVRPTSRVIGQQGNIIHKYTIHRYTLNLDQLVNSSSNRVILCLSNGCTDTTGLITSLEFSNNSFKSIMALVYALCGLVVLLTGLDWYTYEGFLDVSLNLVLLL